MGELVNFLVTKTSWLLLLGRVHTAQGSDPVPSARRPLTGYLISQASFYTCIKWRLTGLYCFLRTLAKIRDGASKVVHSDICHLRGVRCPYHLVTLWLRCLIRARLAELEDCCEVCLVFWSPRIMTIFNVSFIGYTVTRGTDFWAVL